MKFRYLLAGGMLTLATSALASETVIYTYDELGRLIRTSQTGTVNNGVVTDIDYDPAGNRTDYEVTGSNGSGTDSGTTGAPGSGAGNIPTFSISNASATEGGSLTFTVTKSGSASQTFFVNWSTANGSALNGSDYTGNSGLMTFTSSQTSKTITIPTINNNVYEQTEVFYVNLTGASGGAIISDSQGAGTIADDEVPNTPPVANADYGLVSCIPNAYYVMNNDTDADGHTLSLVSVTGALNPYIQGNLVRFSGTTNPGSYNIYYTIQDTLGATASAILRVTWVTGSSCGGGGGPQQ